MSTKYVDSTWFNLCLIVEWLMFLFRNIIKHKPICPFKPATNQWDAYFIMYIYINNHICACVCMYVVLNIIMYVCVCTYIYMCIITYDICLDLDIRYLQWYRCNSDIDIVNTKNKSPLTSSALVRMASNSLAVSFRGVKWVLDDVWSSYLHDDCK